MGGPGPGGGRRGLGPALAGAGRWGHGGPPCIDSFYDFAQNFMILHIFSGFFWYFQVFAGFFHIFAFS